VQGGLLLRKKPPECVLSVYTNSENTISSAQSECSPSSAYASPCNIEKLFTFSSLPNPDKTWQRAGPCALNQLPLKAMKTSLAHSYKGFFSLPKRLNLSHFEPICAAEQSCDE
jgi:hypothetical protein